MQVLDEYYYAISALLTVAMQLLFFFISYTCEFDLLTDLAGSSNFVLLALVSLFLGGNFGSRQLVVTLLLCVSRLWLAGFLLFRVCRRKKDARFDTMRSNFFSFLGFWVFQMFWAFFVSLPVVYINSRESIPTPVGGWDVVGWVVFVLGFLVQLIADLQKYSFRANSANSKDFCQVGLWAWSRHPNYLGEMMMWWGAFVCVIPFQVQTQTVAGWLTLLSPLFTMAILLFLSGLPTAEGKNLRRYYDGGKGQNWEEYRRTTPPIMFLPSMLYACLPNVVKLLCCCEFPFLRYVPDPERHYLSEETKSESHEVDQDGGDDRF